MRGKPNTGQENCCNSNETNQQTTTVLDNKG